MRARDGLLEGERVGVGANGLSRRCSVWSRRSRPTYLYRRKLEYGDIWSEKLEDEDGEEGDEGEELGAAQGRSSRELRERLVFGIRVIERDGRRGLERGRGVSEERQCCDFGELEPDLAERKSGVGVNGGPEGRGVSRACHGLGDVKIDGVFGYSALLLWNPRH